MEPKLKIMTVVGTRPEVIRLSAVIKRLDAVVQQVLVHTGQNYDYQLNDVFFSDLHLRNPDHYLGVDGDTVGKAYGGILIAIEKLIDIERPDAMLVLGDTNSAISAIMAKRKQVPVYHMEAGNRAFDQNVPEEVNRKIVDHVADFNLVYTERARQHLVQEGFPSRRTYLTGSPLREVFDHHRDAIDNSDALNHLSLRSGQYYVVSIHRQENVDLSERLEAVLACLRVLADQHALPIIVSTHPRTRKRLEAADTLADGHDIQFAEPFGYLDYNHLQRNARCVISDSGSISEESAILGFPAVTLRDSMERPEALDAGTIVMTGLDPSALLTAVDLQVDRWKHGRPSVPPEYQIPDTADRVVGLIVGTARLSNAWAGVRPIPS